MRRHERDDTSLLAGLVLAVIGALYLVQAVTSWSADNRWVWPVLLLGLGAAGLAATLPRAFRPAPTHQPDGGQDSSLE